MRRWRKGKDCSVRQCVAVAHASVSPSTSSHNPCVRNVSSFLHECIAIVVVYTDRFVFFSLPFFRALFSFLLSSPCRAPLFFASFYFPTIIILSNFAHSKRWRKFVEVTPRKMRRIPCRVKPRRRGTGWLFIRYEMSTFPRRTRRRSV